MSDSGVRHGVGKLSTRATTLLETASRSKVCLQSYGAPKSRESHLARFQDSRTGVPGKIAIWMWAPWRVTEYTIRGKWLASPRGGRCWLPHQGSEVVAYSRAWNVCVFKVSPSSPVACPNTKKVP